MLLLFANKSWSFAGFYLLLCGIILTGFFYKVRADESIITPGSSGVVSDVKHVDVNKIPDNKEEVYRTIEWPELMPEKDLDALMNPPEFLNDIADGSLEDQISSQVQSAILAASDSRYQEALESKDVISEFNNQSVRIPGFIVPLEFDDDQTITQFFLVPYFGACVHVPPPPPNQVIYASYPKGFKLPALYDPFWITGVLKTTLTENDTATSAYSIEIDSIQPYVP